MGQRTAGRGSGAWGNQYGKPRWCSERRRAPTWPSAPSPSSAPQYIALRVLALRGPAARPRPTQLTPEGAALNAKLADAVAALTRRLYADLDPDDLATAHRVLVEVTERANRLRDEP
jgi:hypothetical protein